MKISIKSGELVPGDFEQSKGRKAVHCSLVSPLDQNPETKYKPYIHQKSHQDQVLAIDLEAAQSSLDLFSQTTNRSVLCCETLFRPSSSTRSDSEMEQADWGKHKQKEKHHQRKSIKAM